MKEEVVDGPDAAHRAPVWLCPTPRAIHLDGTIGSAAQANQDSDKRHWREAVLVSFIALHSEPESASCPRKPSSPECASSSGISARLHEFKNGVPTTGGGAGVASIASDGGKKKFRGAEDGHTVSGGGKNNLRGCRARPSKAQRTMTKSTATRKFNPQKPSPISFSSSPF